MDTPFPLSAVPQAYSQRPVPTPTQVMVHSRPQYPSHIQRREQSLPLSQWMQAPRQFSHQATGPQPLFLSPSQHQPTLRDQQASSIGDVATLLDELQSLKRQVEELKKENSEKQKFLDQAVSEKRAKMGEVEILRTNLQKATTTRHEETEKFRAVKESLEAAQTATKVQHEAELERLRTQLVFQQHEMATRRVAPRAPVTSQTTGFSQIFRSDAPSTPRRHRATAIQSPSPRHQKRLAAVPLHPLKANLPPAGFVNDFAVPARKQDKGKARASLFEQSHGAREQDLDLTPLSPPGSPVKAPILTQVDERMEIDLDSQAADVTNYPDVGLHKNLADDGKTLQQIIGSSKKTLYPLIGLVGYFFEITLFFFTLKAYVLPVDATACNRSCNSAKCPKYNSALACSATI
ncbi:hypothetical protein B0F90DRAFT_1402897 [Multifurca ochricompacta]|uniref:Uncharacterized protein n=1 Tax=Multifurca ochricompacta TaxID=376703 RepID=A0AAD4LXC7_9AGAM|nr:hypothetical protein B0F90DRAFT_1402897 [Multifurca ochricompacta]